MKRLVSYRFDIDLLEYLKNISKSNHTDVTQYLTDLIVNDKKLNELERRNLVFKEVLDSTKVFGNYVYVYLDTSKPGKFEYNRFDKTYSFAYEPYYVGRGINERMYSYHGEEFDKLKEKLSDMGGSKTAIKMHENLTIAEAAFLELEMIYVIGTKKLGTGPLWNLTGTLTGMDNFSNRVKPIPGELNLEYNLANHIIFVLNRSKTLKEASEKLACSERTLYRHMNEHGIKKVDGVYTFHSFY